MASSFLNSLSRLKGHKKKPVFSFHPSTFSFEIDNQDESFKRGLRRKSLTGQTPHSISRQISRGKIHIPVENIGDTIGETERVTVPEPAQCENNAKLAGQPPLNLKKGETSKTKSQDRVPIPVQHEPSPRGELHEQLRDVPLSSTAKKFEQSSKKDTPQVSQRYGKVPYDPKKYQSESSEKEKSPSHIPKVVQNSEKDDDVPVEKSLEKLKTREKILRHQKNEKYVNLTAQEENDIEVTKQDEFIQKEYKLHRFFIIPDGNCLYRAVAEAVLLDQGQHMLLRQLTIDHIREHKKEFENIIEGDVEEFLITAMLEGEWAGYPEILALTRLLDININITTGGSPSNPTVHTTLHYFEPEQQKDGNKKYKKKQSDKYTERQSIWLSWLSNGHYDTFTEGKIENPCYEEWLHSRETRLETDAAIANQLYDDDITKRDHENLLRYRQTDSSNYPYVMGNAHTLPSTSYQNRNFSNFDNTDINNQILSNTLDACLPPQNYPQSTYSHRNTSPSRREEAPPPYSSVTPTYSSSSITTELDEAIARSLQAEEDKKQEYPDYFYA